MTKPKPYDDPALSAPHAEARAQYRTGAHNRRVARETENNARAGESSGDYLELLCTCGRADCDDVLMVAARDYDFVRSDAQRFVVAPDHDTAVDDVVRREEEYWVVEIKPPFRLPNPPAT